MSNRNSQKRVLPFTAVHILTHGYVLWKTIGKENNCKNDCLKNGSLQVRESMKNVMSCKQTQKKRKWVKIILNADKSKDLAHP